MKYQCLVIDDDRDIAKTTAEYFNMFDITTAYVTSSEAALKFLEEHVVALLLLDINLGDQSGFELCKQIRKQSDMPILFISARTSDDDILTALNLGGDDYIKKPYTLNILLAKVKAMLKRYENTVNMSRTEAKVEDARSEMKVTDEIKLDLNYHQLLRQGEVVKLKEMEYRLILYLLEHKNKVISKEELFEKVWDDHFVGEGTLAVHIRHLREKIEKMPNEPDHIKTVWGIGYVFEALE